MLYSYTSMCSVVYYRNMFLFNLLSRALCYNHLKMRTKSISLAPIHSHNALSRIVTAALLLRIPCRDWYNGIRPNIKPPIIELEYIM